MLVVENAISDYLPMSFMISSIFGWNHEEGHIDQPRPLDYNFIEYKIWKSINQLLGTNNLANQF